MEQKTSKDYVLAMYDVRGKQEYIFRGTKLKEVVGGSLIIRDLYKDYLVTVGKLYQPESEERFSWDNFEVRMNETDLNGEVIYDGGGNMLVLFRSEDTFNRVTHDFTYNVIKNTASLRVVGTCVGNLNPDNFCSDRDRLYKQHRVTENTVQNVPAYGSLPISMVNATSSLPIVYRSRENEFSKESLELTKEQLAKYKKYSECKDEEAINEKILDSIAPDKGTDSHIAIIYIDGNSMGAKVQEIIRPGRSYDLCVNELRAFSKKIQEVFIDSKKPVMDEAIKKNNKNRETKRRIVLGAGDEINVIVAGKDAYAVAVAYLEAFDASEQFSSCAGISVFKSHMPYVDAYRIAEECCETGKDKMREKGLANTGFLDFHLCQGAIDTSLEQIRISEETSECSRPWLITDAGKENRDESITSKDEINNTICFLNKLGHSNTKGLLTAAKDGITNLSMELKRIKAHQKKSERDEMKKLWDFILPVNEKRRRMIYDVVLMYDLWLKKEEAGNEKTN